MHSVTRNSSDLSLFEKIVQEISKNLQILSLQPGISIVFLNQNNFFLTGGKNNFGNKVPVSIGRLLLLQYLLIFERPALLDFQ